MNKLTTTSHEKNYNNEVSFSYVLNEDNKSYSIESVVIGDANSVEIPIEYNGLPVNKIGDNAFCSSYYLTTIDIPDNIISIGDGAFKNCPMLSEVKFGSGLIEIGNECFTDDRCLSSVVIPDSVNHVGDSAFYGCASLKSISLGENIDYIGDYCFGNCYILSTIELSENLKYIGRGCFENCSNINEVKYKGSSDDYLLIEIGNDNDELLNSNWIFNEE